MKKISDEEIYKLRKSGMSYRKIVEYFHSNGIEIARNTIASECKRIFDEKGEKEEEIQINRKVGKRERKGISPEEVFKLREKRMSYKQIAEYYYKIGVDVSDQTIGRICKEIYKEKGKTEPTEIINDRVKSISKEELYKLREQGMSYVTIAEQFKKDGIEISSETIRRRCKEIYKEKGKTEPKIQERIRNKRTDINDEKIFELREQGLSYKRIVEYYKENGVDVSCMTIRSRCKEIYKEKGKKEPKPQKSITNKRIDINDEEIFKLREQGMTYDKIAEYYKKNGVNVNYMVIRSRCKKIYEKKGKTELKPQRKRSVGKKRTDINDEKIFELREQGLSYKRIVEYYKENGIDVSYMTIRSRCKEIYKEKGKEEPKTKKRKRSIKNKRTDVTDEEIYKLRKSGMPYTKIEKYLKGKGIIISRNTIANKCKRLFDEKGETEPKTQRGIGNKRTDVTDEEIYELRKSGMSYKKIVRVFHIRGIKISSNTVARKCKKIFAEKGETEPKGKRVNNKNSNTKDNSLGRLNNVLNERIGEKINTEKELAILIDKEERKTKGVEK